MKRKKIKIFLTQTTTNYFLNHKKKPRRASAQSRLVGENFFTLSQPRLDGNRDAIAYSSIFCHLLTTPAGVAATAGAAYCP